MSTLFKCHLADFSVTSTVEKVIKCMRMFEVVHSVKWTLSYWN